MQFTKVIKKLECRGNVTVQNIFDKNFGNRPFGGGPVQAPAAPIRPIPEFFYQKYSAVTFSPVILVL